MSAPMDDLAAKLAEALTELLGLYESAAGRCDDNDAPAQVVAAREALRLYDEAKAQPADLPVQGSQP